MRPKLYFVTDWLTTCNRLHRITTLLLLPFLLGIGAMAQQPPAVSISVKNKPLPDVLQIISGKTGVSFFYNIEELNKLPRVTLKADKMPLDELLLLLFKSSHIRIVHTNNVIALMPEPVTRSTVSGMITDDSGQPLSGVSIMERKSGSLTTSDSGGRFHLTPVLPAVIQVSFIGMQTQSVAINDTRPLSIKMQPVTLSISEVKVNGYMDVVQRYYAGSATRIDAATLDRKDQLSVDNMLQEKVTGLNINANSADPFAVPKIRLRGTSTLMGSKDPTWVIDGVISLAPIKLPSADINSLDNLNLMNSCIVGLDLKDVKQIDVLKDAAAAAIYGINSGNGVIVITTRKGAYHQKPQLTFSQMTTVVSRPTYRHLNLMDASQRMALSKEVVDQQLSLGGTVPGGFEEDYLAYLNGRLSPDEFAKRQQAYEAMNTDWFNILFNNGVNQHYNLVLTGGSNNTSYYFSLGRTARQSQDIATHVQQNTGMLRLEHRTSFGLQTGVKLSLSGLQGAYPYQVNPYSYAYSASRVLPFKLNDQRFYYPYNPPAGGPSDSTRAALFNIASEMDNSSSLKHLTRSSALVNADWTLSPSFKLHGLYSFNASDVENATYAGEATNYIATNYRLGLAPGIPYSPAEKAAIYLPAGGEYMGTHVLQKTYDVRHSIEYNLKHTTHYLQVMAGAEFRQTTYRTKQPLLLGYYPDSGKIAHPPPPEEYPLYNAWLNYAGYNNPDKTYNKKYRQLSWYGILVYGYKDRYIVNLNLRQDGANYISQFGNNEGERTWSAAFKWNISEEPWWQRKHSENMLALRFSYGYNISIPEVGSARLITSSTIRSNLNGEDQTILTNIPNAGLSWEKIYITNAGVDFSLFHNRLTGTLEVYHKRSGSLVANLDLAEENGVSSSLQNEAGICNKGIELSLLWQAIQQKKWQWSIGSNFSYNHSRILQTNFTNAGVINNQQQYLSGNIIASGLDPNMLYAYRFTGLDKQGMPTFYGIYDKDYATRPDPEQYFATVFKPMGSRIPQVNGSLYTNLTYRHWTLSAVVQVKLAYWQRLVNLYPTIGFLPSTTQNISKDIAGRWKQPGDEAHTNIPSERLSADVQKNLYYSNGMPGQYNAQRDYGIQQGWYPPAPLYLMSTQPWDMYNNSDIRVINASHARLSTLSLQYSIQQPQKPLKGFLKGVSCYAQVHDLLLLADKRFHGQDPEFSAGVMPRLPSFTFGTDLNF